MAELIEYEVSVTPNRGAVYTTSVRATSLTEARNIAEAQFGGSSGRVNGVAPMAHESRWSI